jgi:hypothetical protein
MIKHRTAGLLVAILAGLVGAAWAADGVGGPGEGGPAGATEFKSRAARDAATKYGFSVERLNQEHQKKLTAARRAYVVALTAAKDEATRAANLDEAVRLRDAIADLEKEAPPADVSARADGPAAAQATLAKKLAGTTWEDNGKQIRFNVDGTMTRQDSKEPWAWAAVNGTTIVMRRGDAWTVGLTFDESLKSFSLTEYGNGTKKETGKRMPS